MKKAIAVLMFTLAAVAVFIAGCGSKYNATLISNADDIINPNFLEQNRVSGAFYPNPDYEEGVDSPDERYIFDESSPGSRTFIITEKSQFDDIFDEDKFSIDLTDKMAILYIFADVYGTRDYKLSDIEKTGDGLEICCSLEYSAADDATMPFMRCFVVTLDKTDISEVTFINQK